MLFRVFIVFVIIVSSIVFPFEFGGVDIASASVTTSYFGMWQGSTTLTETADLEYATKFYYPQTQLLAQSPYGTGDTGGSSNGTHVFMFGGELIYGSSISPYTQIYNPTTDRWSLGTNMTTPRWCAGVAYYNGEFYVAGGEAGVLHGDSLSRKLEVYNPTTNSWRTMTDIPAGLAGPCMIEAIPSLGKLYLFHHNVIYELDPSGDGGMGTYTAKTSPAFAREYGVWSYVSVSGQNRIYSIAGIDDSVSITNTNYYYNVDSDNWSAAQAVAPYGSVAPATAQCVYNGRYIYYGGGSIVLDPAEVSNRIYAYDTNTNTWSGILAYFACTMDGRVAAMIGNTIYFAGGWMGGNGYAYCDSYDASILTATSGNVTTISMNVTSGATGNARLGIYSDNAGVPNTLVLDAGAVALAGGWNTISGLRTSITPGVYWLVSNVSATNTGITAQAGEAGLTVPSYYKSHAYGALDASWGAAGTSLATFQQIRATVEVSTSSTPTIRTSASTSTTNTTATLNAQVTNLGGESGATVYFYWGTTNGGTTAASWSNNATPTSPSQPQGAATAYYNATGLTPNTLYYFNASANNTGGTSWGNVQAFYTNGYSPTSSSGSWSNPLYAYSWESNNTTYKTSDSTSNETYGGYGISLVSMNITQVLIKPFAFSTPATGVLDSNQPTANSNGTYAWNNPERAYDPGGSGSNNYTTATYTTPTYRATGTAGYATTGNVTVGLPAGMSSGDIVILVTSCNWTNTVSILANGSISTWTAIASPKKPTTSNLLSENLYVWWGKYVSGSTGPTIIGTDHVVGRTVAYYNCNQTSPIDVSINGTEESSDTSMSFATGLTTTYNNELVCVAASTGVSGNSTAAFSSFANTSLTSVAERMDNRTAAGGGGGFGFAEGVRAVAGTAGTWTSTYAASSYKSYIAFALRPDVLTTVEIQQIYSSFGFTDVGGTVTKVEIGYEGYASVASQLLNLCTSANGGTSYSANHTTSALATSDNNTPSYIDVTADQAWTWTLLNDANLKIRLGAKWVSGSPTFFVDNLYVRVTYNDAADEQLRVDVTWDGGLSWANADNVTLSSTETTYTVNATSLTSWTNTKLSDANFKVAIFPLTVGATSNVSVDWLPVMIYYSASGGEAPKSITNTPNSIAFGIVRAHTTSYSGGGAYSNPVTDGQCALTITNTGADGCDLTIRMTDWTAVGGNTWVLIGTAPDGNQIRVSVVYSGQNPASALILTNSDQTLYEGLGAGNSIKWDIKVEFGGDSGTGLFSDGKQHTGTITITAS